MRMLCKSLRLCGEPIEVYLIDSRVMILTVMFYGEPIESLLQPDIQYYSYSSSENVVINFYWLCRRVERLLHNLISDFFTEML